MHPDITAKLLAINREFYQTFADSFDATRQRLQPGTLRLMQQIQPADRVLDLGCGNGNLFHALHLQGFQGSYTGVDFSPGLLEAAREQPGGGEAVFHQADLASEGWTEGLNGPFDKVLALAVFHHLPGRALHLRVLSKINRLLGTNGCLFLSNWQFLKSPRWRDRIQPWSRAGLAAEAVEPGDYLLDWRRGGVGFRYVHYFEESELGQLAEQAGFTIQETFYSDGKEGNLAIYQVWRPAAPRPAQNPGID
jgi:SAM-dependent methyltransferase